jgi:succinylarginine dihydrolase
MFGPVFVAKSRSYSVRPWCVYVPQEDLRYVGAVEAYRFDSQEVAQAKADEILAAKTYAKDAAGWWRPVA